MCRMVAWAETCHIQLFSCHLKQGGWLEHAAASFDAASVEHTCMDVWCTHVVLFLPPFSPCCAVVYNVPVQTAKVVCSRLCGDGD